MQTSDPGNLIGSVPRRGPSPDRITLIKLHLVYCSVRNRTLVSYDFFKCGPV
jgi:hypothetical protein